MICVKKQREIDRERKKEKESKKGDKEWDKGEKNCKWWCREVCMGGRGEQKEGNEDEERIGDR